MNHEVLEPNPDWLKMTSLAAAGQSPAMKIRLGFVAVATARWRWQRSRPALRPTTTTTATTAATTTTDKSGAHRRGGGERGPIENEKTNRRHFQMWRHRPIGSSRKRYNRSFVFFPPLHRQRHTRPHTHTHTHTHTQTHTHTETRLIKGSPV